MTNIQNPKKKSFLFLQGPHGKFFRFLGEELRNGGCDIYRINFNGGDYIDWPFALAYKHSLKMWPEWIYNFAKHHAVTDLVLYGDCRPLHKAAIISLRKLGVRVHVFEEGYIRPNWVTYEEDGVNGYSKIREHLDSILNNKKFDKPNNDAIIPIKHNSKFLLKYCIRYYFFKWLGVLFFPRYKTHRPINSFYEAIIWIKRYLTLGYSRNIALKKAKQLIQSKNKYFLFLLQLDTDYQIREHSSFRSMKEAIIKVIYSFADHADNTHKLVIKNHPLDNGYQNYGKFIKNIASELNIVDRLIYLDGGNLPELLDNSLGVIAINSTAGLQSIHHKKPTKTLGEAIYDHPKLINNCSLEKFWHSLKNPNTKAYHRFRGYLLTQNQINGSFYDPQGIKILLHKIIIKLNT